MKKKLFICFLSALTVATCAIGLSACNDGSDSDSQSGSNDGQTANHTHSYGDWFTSKAATCTKNGEEKQICSDCGNVKTKTVFALGHSYGEEFTSKQATCTESGEVLQICLNCGDTKKEMTAAFGHSYGERFTSKQATCTENGEEKQICSNCGNVNTQTVSATGHWYGKWFTTEQATCTENGEKKQICSDCGDVKTKTVFATGHQIHTEEGVAPTAVSYGLTESKYCLDCGETLQSRKLINPLNSDFVAACDYKAVKGGIPYRYSYSLNVLDDGNFVLTALSANGSNYNLSYQTGETERISGDLFCLTYDNGASKYIQVNGNGFVFCHADGTGYDNEIEKAETVTLQSLATGNSDYGYNYLLQEAHGAQMQALYARMYLLSEAFSTCTDNLTEADGLYPISLIDISNYNLTIDEAVSVWKVFYLENPSYYWLSNSLSFYGTAMRFCVSPEYAEYAARRACDSAIGKMAKECATYLSSAANDLEKAVAIHDFILNRIDYAYVDGTNTPSSEIWAHNLVGAAVKGYGVCETYAKAYQYLCLLNGIECITVSGTAQQDHAWNMIQIENEWYSVDLTWDDSSQNISYTNVGLSASETKKSHTADTPEEYGINYLYGLPALSEERMQLVRLYKNGNNVGLYRSIDYAFDEMTDSSAEYKVRLFKYEAIQLGLFVHYSVNYYVESDRSPSVGKITVEGYKTEFEKDEFSITGISFKNAFTFNCNLDIKNIKLRNCSLIDINGYRLTTYGYLCDTKSSKLYSNKETSALIVNTDYHTEIDECRISTVEVNSGGLYFLSNTEITDLKMHSSTRIYGRSSVTKTNASIANIYALERYTTLWVEMANVTIGNIYARNEYRSLSINVQFGKLEEYPELKITGNLPKNVTFVIDGSISYIIEDMNGNVINRYTESANPFTLERPIANISFKVDFSSLKIEFVIWGKWAGGYSANRTPCYKQDENGDIVLDVEITDDGYCIKDGVLYGYIGEETSLVLPAGITAIGGHALLGSDMTEIVIPKSVTKINEMAFAKCNKLTKITYQGKVSQWEKIEKKSYWNSDSQFTVQCVDGII